MSPVFRKKLMNVLLNVAGSTLLAFGVCAFISPFHLIVGGATGISLIVHRLVGVNVSTVALIINLAVLPLGYWIGKKKLVLGSLLSSLVYPLALAVFERIPYLTTIADSIVLATLCGALVCGTGVGLVMKSGGSTGGIDIPVIFFHRLFHIPVSRAMKYTDTCIMLAQIPLFGLTGILYGLIYTYLMTWSLNRVLTYGEERLRIVVISEQYEMIREKMIENDFGVTMVYAESGYTRTPVQKLESIMTSSRYRKAQLLIEECDPAAFITIEKVTEVHGQGFTMKRDPIDLD